jgi:Na+-driven multidrug efflux pump
MLNLATPALHTISALECFSCRSLQVSGYRRYARDEQNNQALPVATFLAAPFIWNFSGAFDGQIFREPYPDEYSGYASWPLRFVGLLPTAQSVQVVIGGSLRALERPNPMFCSSARGGVSAVALGVPLALHFGIGGALLGMLISYALMGALTVVFLARFSRWEQV